MNNSSLICSILFETVTEKMERYNAICDELLEGVKDTVPLSVKKHVPGQKFRVLSLDGGGIKCIYQCALLKRIKQRFPDFFEKVDLITGLSASSLPCVAIQLGYDMDFVEHLMEVSSLETFKNESHIAGIAGHQFSNKFLRLMGTRLFGDKKIDELNRYCCVQSFLIDTGKDSPERKAKAMLYNNFGFEHYDKTLRDICLQSAAAPGYFNPVNEHVDGSVIVNNPLYLTFPLVVGSIKGLGIPKEDIVAVSIGSGYPTVPYYDIEQMADAGLVQWLIKLTDFIIFSRKEMGVVDSKLSLGDRYFRFEPRLPQEIEICDVKSIDQVKQMGEELDLSGLFSWIEREW